MDPICWTFSDGLTWAVESVDAGGAESATSSISRPCFSFMASVFQKPTWLKAAQPGSKKAIAEQQTTMVRTAKRRAKLAPPDMALKP